MRARDVVVVWHEESSERGSDAEDVEVVSADHVPVDCGTLPAGRYGQRYATPGRDRVERTRAISKIGVERIGALVEHLPIPARGPEGYQRGLRGNSW